MTAAGVGDRFESVEVTVGRVARERPDAVAVASPRGDVSYRELTRRAGALAGALAAEGFAAGSLLPVLSRDPREVIVAMLAALAVRGAFVPLDPELPDERLRALLADLDSPWGYADEDLVERLAAHLPEAGDGRVLSPLDGGGTAPAVVAAPDDLAYVFFTSGSTGRPKGIAGRLCGIDHFVRWESSLVGAGPGMRVSQLTSASFDAVLRDVFLPLCTGGTVCVPESRERLADGARLAGWLAEQRIEVLHCVPSLLRALLDAEPARESLEALRWVLVAGERLPPADVRRWWARAPAGARLVNLYGPSETTMVKLFHVVEPADADRPSVPIGRPMPGSAAAVVDESLRPCPPGVVGEILIRTPYRSLGYFREPELTREAFVPNPLTGDAGDPVYRTGDLGRLLRNGELELIGRRDLQVKIHGVRVEPAEVEDALGRHPAVRDQVVVAREDAAGEVSLCAYVVAEPAVDAGELRAHCRSLLPQALVPARVVLLEALPRTFSGKVDRRALPEPPSDPVAEDDAGAPPAGELEELLAGLWAEVLGRERVARDRDFFALGGHSLMAARLLNRVAAALGVELAMRDLAEASTVAGLASVIEERRGAGRAEPAFEPDDGAEPAISFAQERLWFLDQLAPGGSSYNLPSGVRLEGELSVAALEATLAEVARRHEALRSSFPDDGGRPVLAVAPSAVRPLPVADLGGLPAERRESELARLAAEESRRPFRLDRGPLFRTALVRVDRRRHGVLATLHHVVGDAWSTALLVREVSSLYGAFAGGLPSPLAEPALSYGRWAAWQRRWLAGEAAAASLEVWRRRLAGLPALLELPTDRPRPPVQRYRGGRVRLHLPPALRDRLQALARRRGTTLFTVLLAGFTMLLQRLTGRDDLPVGTPMAGRRQLAAEELIGLFVNSVVLRGDLSGDPTCGALTDRLRALVLEADAHQAVPFERVVEALQPQRSLAHAPLFQVMLVLQNAPREALDLAGLRWTPLAGEPRGAKLDWTVSLVEGGAGLTGVFEYDRDLFDRVTVERAAARFERLLAALAEAPAETRVSRLDGLARSERHQLLREWNDSAREHVERRPIHALIADAARRHPERTAVELDGSELSYGDLDRLANRVAHRLCGLGVGPEVPVGVMLERSPMLVIALLGVLKAGGAYVPLDPSYPPERLAFMAADARAAVLVTQRSLAGELPGAGGATLVIDDPGAGLDAMPAHDPGVPVDDDQLAYVIFTSGSTGRPKGAMNSHGAIRNRLLWMQETYRLGPGDRVLHKTPFSFDVSVWELFWPLIAGARMVLARAGRHGDSGYLVERIVEAGVTVLHFVPSMLQAFLEEPDVERCRTLRLVVCSGEALGGAAGRRCLERLGAELHNLYGPTEAAVDVTYRACRRGESGPAVPLGRPVANTVIHLVGRRGEAVPHGVAGELLIGGAQVGRGYHRRPALTAERFVPDPFGAVPGARLYRTGDLARRLQDGELDYLGRIDHQVKIRGFRVELGEIEAALGALPAVRECAVVAHRAAGGDLRLAAYVVAGEPDPRTLASFLAGRLPEYMVPATWTFLDRLPVTPSGKLDRRALPEPAAPVRTAGEPPEGEVEREVAAVWCEVLRIEEVGRDDDFFAAGGHSLLATQVLARLRGRFGIAPTLTELFQGPTVRALAALIEERLVEHVDEERIEEMLALLEGLDDEQAAALERLGEEP